MARILILEDCPNRIRQFKQNFVGNDVLLVSRAAEAISALESRDWDWLFLDHDLGGEAMVESGPGTGYEVACFLEGRPERKPGHIAVHSLNPVGAGRIAAALPYAKMLPGAWCFGFEKVVENSDDWQGLPDVTV